MGGRAWGVLGHGGGRFGRVAAAAVMLLMLGASLVSSPAAAASFDALGGTDGCTWMGFSPNPSTPEGCTTGEVDNYEAILAAPEGRDVYVADDRGLVRRYSRNAATGALSTGAGDCWTGYARASCTQMLGIGYPTALALSPNARHLYVGNGDGVIAVLQRDPATGALSQAGAPDACYGPISSAPACTFARISDDWITNLEVTPDGSSVLASTDDDSLTIFSRDLLTGRLTQPAGYRACWGSYETDNEGNPCRQPTRETWTYQDTATTPDGLHVYVAAYDELLRFDRDPATSELTFRECFSYWAHDGCTVIARGRWWDSLSIALSPDGSTLYSLGWNELLSFDVDATSGSLTMLAGTAGCIQRADSNDDPSCGVVRGWDSGESIQAAPDGATVYAVTYNGSLVTFNRDPATGVLTQRAGRAGCVTASERPNMSTCLVSGETSPSWRLTVSPDSANVYALAQSRAILAYGSPTTSCRDITEPERRNDASFDVRARCVGLDPDLRQFEIVTPPTRGSVTVIGGILRVTPDPGWAGTDTFTYRAIDGVANTAPATVTIPTRIPSPPVALTDPTMSGSAIVGATLTATAATWTQPLTPSYPGTSWERCNASATACSYAGSGTIYRVKVGDLGSSMRVVGFAWNADGRVERPSAVTGTVADATGPTLAGEPYVTGYTRVGNLMEARVAWQSTLALSTTWTWERCDATLTTCAPIAGASARDYRTVAADAGSRLRVISTATDSRATDTATAATTVIAAASAPYRYLSARPVISGIAHTGETLTVTPALLSDGNAGDSTALQWRRCADNGSNCEDLPGETATTHLVTAADHGSSLLVFQRTWFDGRYRWQISPPSAEVRNAAEVGTMPPVNTTPPSLDGVVAVDRTLYAVDGAWNGVDPFTYTYQWQRCDATGAACVPITGATARYYQVRFEDVGATYRLVVTATNVDGSATSTTAATVPIPEPRPTTQYPYSTIGSIHEEGRALTATLGTWRSVSAVTGSRYEFFSCPNESVYYGPPASCTLIYDGPSATIVPTTADVDRWITWRVHATNAVGTTANSWQSNGPVRPAPPVSTAPPTVSGSARIGSTLTATAGTWTASRPIDTRLMWQTCAPDGTACGSTGVASASYTVSASDEYRTIRVVEYANATGAMRSFDTPPATSSVTSVVPLEAPHPAGTLVMSGLRKYYWSLTAYGATWSSPAAFTSTLQWQRCDASGGSCVDIPGATSSVFTPQLSEIDQTVRLVATATNAAGTSTRSTTADVILPPPPTVNSAYPPTIAGTRIEGQRLTATVGPYTSLGATTVTWQWVRCTDSSGTCTDIAGATASTYDLATADIGAFIVAREIVTNAAGSVNLQSNPSTRIYGTPATIVAAPQVSGLAQVNSALTASSTWSSTTPVTVTHRWEACDAATQSACSTLGWGDTLVVPQTALDRVVIAVAEAANGGGTARAVSAPTTVVVGPPTISLSPSIYGTATVRGSLGSNATWVGTVPVTATRAWLRCDAQGTACAPISGANDTTYRPVLADLHRIVRLRLTVRNAYGEEAATSNGLWIIGEGPRLQRNGTITGDARTGALLTNTGSQWLDAATVTTRWERCRNLPADCDVIGIADAATYVTTSADRGLYVRVVEIARNDAGTATSFVVTAERVRFDPTAIPIVDLTLPAIATGGRSTARWRVPEGLGETPGWQLDAISGSTTSRLGAPTRISTGSMTSWTVTPALASTTCLRLRIHVSEGWGAWSPYRCTSAPRDANRLATSGSWRTIGTSRSTTTRGAQLTMSTRQRIDRITVRAQRCPTCGSLQVELGNRRIGTINLRGRSGVVAFTLPPLALPATGAVRVRVVSTRRLVRVYGLALTLDAP